MYNKYKMFRNRKCKRGSHHFQGIMPRRHTGIHKSEKLILVSRFCVLLNLNDHQAAGSFYALRSTS